MVGLRNLLYRGGAWFFHCRVRGFKGVGKKKKHTERDKSRSRDSRGRENGHDSGAIQIKPWKKGVEGGGGTVGTGRWGGRKRGKQDQKGCYNSFYSTRSKVRDWSVQGKVRNEEPKRTSSGEKNLLQHSCYCWKEGGH